MDLDPTRRRTIRDVRDIPPDILVQARQLNDPEAAEELLLYYTHASAALKMAQFVLRAFVHGEDPEALLGAGWSAPCTGLVVPDWSLDEKMTRPCAELLAPFGGVVPQRRYRASRQSWDLGLSDFSGLPALQRDDLVFRWADGVYELSHPHARVYTPIEPERLEPIGDVDVAVRRWIAAGLARRLLEVGWMAGGTCDKMLADSGFSPQACSADATIAARALFRELTELPLDEICVPGFLGPDDWYES